MSAKKSAHADARRGIGAEGQNRAATGTTEMPDEAATDAPAEAKSKQGFGGMGASEAGRKGAQVREERKRAQAEAAAAASDGRVVFVRTPVALGDIVARLSTLAAKGDTSAARELRSWLTEYPVEETTDVASLDRRTREALKAELLMRIGQRDSAQEGVDPDDPSPLRAQPVVHVGDVHRDDGATGQAG